MELAAFYPGIAPEKAVLKMEVRLYVGNLAKSTTQDELGVLFTQAGEVTATEVIRDRKSGESRGFAFITMGGQDDADTAVGMFNEYSLDDHALKVSMATSKVRRDSVAILGES